MRRSGLERASVALHDAMKDYGFSADVVSAGQSAHAEDAILPGPEAHKSADGEHNADQLATALAMMQATLESHH